MRRAFKRRGLTTGQTVAIVVGAVVVLVVACFGTALLIGLLLPAIGQARETARVTMSSSQLRSFEQARHNSLMHFPDDEPTLENLIDNGRLIVESTISPFGPVPDGRGDYWFLATRPEIDNPADAARFIVGYDRAMYATHRTVVVLYEDGTIEMLAIDEFNRLAALPPNEGRDFDLPARTRR